MKVTDGTSKVKIIDQYNFALFQVVENFFVRIVFKSSYDDATPTFSPYPECRYLRRVQEYEKLVK